MTKKVVSKYSYLFWTLIFHSLCLSGLVWQVVQISINFFQFDTIKDINVTVPESSNDIRKVYNLCFRNFEIIDVEMYSNIAGENTKNHTWSDSNIAGYNEFTMEERFNSTKNLLQYYSDITTEYLFGENYCYQLNRRLLLHTEQLENVSTIKVSTGYKFPYFDYWRFLTVKKPKEKEAMMIKSFSYTMNRKSFPYTDKCIDYHTSGYDNRYEAIAECSNQYESNYHDQLSALKYFPKENTQYRKMYENMTIQKLSSHSTCSWLFRNPECNESVFITMIESNGIINLSDRQISVELGPDSDPSFFIESKPRIDNIEYVTYVLGAMGSWFGFSFLMMNPIPYFITAMTESSAPAPSEEKKDSASGNLSADRDNEFRISASEHARLKEKVLKNESLQEQDRERILILEHDILKLETMNSALMSEINILISDVNQTSNLH